MLPSQLAKSGTEEAEQTALFAYVNAARLHGFEIADMWSEIGTPALAKSSFKETGIPALPQLAWFHAIANGGARGDNKKSAMIRGAQLKATGVKAGVADTFLPYPVFRGYDHNAEPTYYHGLYIEMKVRSKKPKREGSKGGMSDEQIEFRDWALANSYGFATCYGWEEARDIIKSYVEYSPL